MSNSQPRILCVDDEPRILEGLESNLGWHFDVHLASSGAEGIETIEDQEPFAVVISDMRMPQMNGATFLAKVRELAPETSRILLTGYADIDAAMAAVNQGNIFRFLSKPCTADLLIAAVQAAAEQFRLVRAERLLLEKTLGGVTQVLTDVLSLAAPAAFSRARRIRDYVCHMTEKLQITDRWQYELAAMLSQIGCITLPTETLDKALAGSDLDSEEQRMMISHPTIGGDLLAQIPRLELVAEIVSSQAQDQDSQENGIETRPNSDEQKKVLGAMLLRVALEVDRKVVGGNSVRKAANVLRKHAAPLPPYLLDLLLDFKSENTTETVKAVSLQDLRCFMILDEDVRSRAGGVIVSKGYEVNALLIERLRNFASGVGVIEPIRVRVPSL